MPKYPYRQLGISMDRNYRNDLNQNLKDIESDFRELGAGARQAIEAAHEAETQAIYAKEQGDYANEKGTFASEQGTYAKQQGESAKEQANQAKNQAEYAKATADSIKTNWITPPVSTFADIATKVPSPKTGDTIQTTTDGKVYRYQNGKWEHTQQVSDNAITDIQNKLSQSARQTQIIGHGLSVLNGEVNAPVETMIFGNTKISLGNTTLDATKKYVLADKKYKLKWTDGSVTEGIAKFQGKNERPAIIRVANFEDKVSGSTVENGHVSKRVTKDASITSLLTPSTFTGVGTTELTSTDYSNANALNGTSVISETKSSGAIAQMLFSFNLIEEVERKIGRIPRTTVADKVAWLKNNVEKLTANWHGLANSPTGRKATLAIWSKSTNSWVNSVSHSNSIAVGKLSISQANVSGTSYLNTDGIVHFLAYTEPSDGVTASTINTDYIELEIELKRDADFHQPSVPLYEVSQEEYNKILVEWDEMAVLSRYPRVQGVQHLANPAVIAEGENLIPSFYEWALHANAKVISPYELELNATGAFPHSYIYLPVVVGKTYNLKLSENTGVAYIYKGKTTTFTPSMSGAITTNTFSFTVDSSYNGFISISLTGITAGKYTFSQPMLTLGSTPKPFVTRNPSYLFADVKLGQIGDKKDVLSIRGNEKYLHKVIEKDFILDGSHDWTHQINRVGYKRFYVNSSITLPALTKEVIITKFNGELLYRELGGNGEDGENRWWISSQSKPYLTISNIDSGFKEEYIPTANERKAYFNGWKVKTADGNGKPTAWKSVVDGSDAPTQTVAYVSSNLAPNYTPYKLSYVLATPQTINVADKVEGDIKVNGLTQIEVTSGVIVREKIMPQAISGNHYINRTSLPLSLLKNRPCKIVGVFKNGLIDTRWTFSTNAIYDNIGAFIVSSDFDTTAEYSVTYLVLDRHLMTTNATEVKLTYANNIRSALDDVVTKQNDVATQQSVLFNIANELLKRVKALEVV